MGRETEKRQLRAGNFTMNNGRVLSTCFVKNTMHSAAWKKRLVMKALKDRNSWIA